MNSLQKALIILGTQRDDSKKLLSDIQEYLKEKEIYSDLHIYSGEVSLDIECINKFDCDYDFAISLGGDGTVLFAARYCAPRSIPVFPINLGHFGFIANIEPKDWKPELEKFLNGKTELYERHLLSASVFPANISSENIKAKDNFVALNDLVIAGSGVAKLIELDISFNGISFGVFRADGIIVSTPTGSTAYAAGLGGPILDPEVSAFLLIPIAPFSLSNRPIVLPSNGELEIKVLPSREKNIVLSLDGQAAVDLKEGDVIKISRSDTNLKMVECSPDAFYKALRSKLRWSGDRS